MNTVVAVLSMLHEPPERNSATRRFRNRPVLDWTLRRLASASSLNEVVILCWEDQLADVSPVATEHEAAISAKGPRVAMPQLDAVTAARRWADGWRGGLLSTCDFDLGFHAPWVKEITERLNGDGILLIDPAAGLVDAGLVEGLVSHARLQRDAEILFSQAAPGLCGVLLRPVLIGRLVTAPLHPGKLLHYLPDQPSRDPIGTESCAPVPTPVARTTHRFKLDSDRQLRRVEHAMESLNGQLIGSGSEELVRRMDTARFADALPREVRLELTTRRATSPIFWPASHLSINRPDLTPECAAKLFAELGALDDVRLTLAGVGDALLHPQFFDIVKIARDAGIAAIHAETDLLDESERIAGLATAGVDVVSVHLPAMTANTYTAVMGVDAMGGVLENLKLLLENRQSRWRAVPIIVPLFTKCRQNLGEMEAWYDQWLRILGSAVIEGPSDCAGQIPDVAAADMAPPRRRACARLASRVSILSDGSIVSCEQDVLGKHVLGRIGADSLADVWRTRFGAMRAEHQIGQWSKHPLCAGCREWHRP